MEILTPEGSPQMCMGCGSTFPPDPPDEETGRTQRGGICPECDGPLQLVSPEVAGYGISPHTPAVGPGSPPFGMGQISQGPSVRVTGGDE